MPLDPATLNALKNRWMLDEMGLDQEANLARINARQSLEDLRRTNKRSTERSADLMADRGLARSGIARKVDMEREQDFQRAMGRTDTAKTVALAAIARKRLQGKAAYDQSRAQLALGMGVAPSVAPSTSTDTGTTL
jgi:hypothetical protein